MISRQKMEMQIIVAPLVGGIIGYVTNGIAIKMLFRPLYPKYLFGKQIPFTPGLIPKERNRLAKTLGNAISHNLMNREVLEKTLLSDDLLVSITDTIDRFVETQHDNTQSLRDFMYGLLSKEEIDAMLQNGKDDLSRLLQAKLSDSQLGGKISHIVVEHAIQKVQEGVLGMFGADRFISLIAKPAENLLAKNINDILQNSSGQLVNDLLSEESEKLLSMRMCDIVTGKQEQITQLKEYVLSIYKKLITDHLPRTLEALNISKIVESRINEMDVKEVENLLFQVMDKELKAIVWLGALLGLIMGFVNILI